MSRSGSSSIGLGIAAALGFWLVKRKWIIALFGLLFHVALLFIVQIFRLDVVSIFLYLTFLLPFLSHHRRESPIQ